MAELFEVQKAAISKHLKNIFSSGELMEDSVVSVLETTAADGKNIPRGTIIEFFATVQNNCITPLQSTPQRRSSMTGQTARNRIWVLQHGKMQEVLHHKGKVTAAIAKAFVESEFEKYRVIQDRQYQSDFDRLVASTEEKD